MSVWERGRQALPLDPELAEGSLSRGGEAPFAGQHRKASRYPKGMVKMRRIATLLGGCALLASLASAGWSQNWPSSSQAVRLLTQTAAELASFDLDGEIATYTRKNLWEYINGEAERYFAYDYEWTVAAGFKDLRSNVSTAVDIFRFATPLDAFGAATIDRDPAVPGEIIPLGGQASLISAYWAGNQIHVWRGPLYVRILPGSLSDRLRPAALELAQAVVSRLPLMEKDPPVFKIPPTRGLIAESVKFRRRDVLGQAFLKNALLALYGRRLPNRKLDVDMELLLFDGTDPRGARSTHDHLGKYLGEGGAVRPVASLGEAAFVVRHPRHGMTYAMRQGRYVAMLRKVKNSAAAEAMLREIGKNIRLAR